MGNHVSQSYHPTGIEWGAKENLPASIRSFIMPVISMFYGIIIRMFYRDNQQHHLPHIHAEYQGQVVVFAIEDSSILDGFIPPAKKKLVDAWIEIRRDELLADWALAVEGEKTFRIKGLE
jgi:uncharacterized protein DUF4160